jgi:hypothetical protein
MNKGLERSRNKRREEEQDYCVKIGAGTGINGGEGRGG